MTMKKILLFLLTFTYLGLFSQNNSIPEHHCGYDIGLQILKKEGRLQEQMEWYKNSIRELYSNINNNHSTNAVYQVPVVVHIVWDNANGINVTDAQVATMIDNLNKDYARLNDDVGNTRAIFAPIASSVDIQFCLAKTDPNGLSTTGITRTETTHGQFNPENTGTNPNSAEDIKSTAAGGIDSWDTQRYLNIWFGDLTAGTGMGTVGYSTLPGSHGAPNDGFIMDCVAVANETLDRTPTHEIGHYFGLLHPWGPGNTGDCTADDGIADTPLTGSDHLGQGCNPSPEPDDCAPYGGADVDQWENYMDYSNCTNMFTQDQAALMKQTLETTRASLLGNNLCSEPVLTADFTPNTPTVTINAGQSVTFTDASSGPTGVTSWDWTFNSGSPSSANTQGPQTITYNTPGVYPVSLTVGDGTTTDTKSVAALVEVLDVLNANFSADITYAGIGETVTFSDLTSGPDAIVSWDWDFGDGNTDNIQNPTHVYSAIGLYTVTLTVNDGTNNDTETKTEYIEVYDPLALNIIDFVGIPTTINVGDQVNFEVNCNQADADIDSVRWYFEGADNSTFMQTNTNSFNMTYSTGGIFDVECRVYRDNATDGDTLIKSDYIVVIAPDSVPVANFVASQSNIPVGTTIDFINLTNIIDRLDSVRWFIQTDASTTVQSTDINPTGFTYNTVGDFDVHLFVYSPFGNHDTLKVGHVHVYDPANLNPISVNFEATTVRLITEGESVQFEDLSQGDIQNWKYVFDRGAGDSFLEYEYDQNPLHTFLTAGIYHVTLIASNTTYADTLTKERYIIVTTTPWPEHDGYCDTLTNIRYNENQLTFRKADYPSWGYFPGHYAKKTSETSSEKKIVRYAEKFETYTPDVVNAVLIPVSKAYAGDNDAYIQVILWDADDTGRPNNQLTAYSANKIKINDLQTGMYNYIQLDEPVNVDSVFFVGFKLKYKTTTSPQDTFAVHMAPERPLAEDNTLYVSKLSSGESWLTPTEFLEFNLNTSMALKVMGCVVSVPEIKEIEASLNIYPNPASDRIYIDLGNIKINQVQVDMYDIVGKKISTKIVNNQSNKLELDVNNCTNGFYLVNINVNGYQITKKVLIQK